MPRLKKLIMHSSKELISLEFLHLTRKPGGSLEWFRMRFCLAWLLSFSKLHLCAGASISYSTFPKDWNLSAKDVIRLHRFIFSRRVTSDWRSKLESWSSSVFSAHVSVDGTLWKSWVPLHVPNTRWMTSMGKLVVQMALKTRKFIDFCHNGFLQFGCSSNIGTEISNFSANSYLVFCSYLYSSMPNDCFHPWRLG